VPYADSAQFQIRQAGLPPGCGSSQSRGSLRSGAGGRGAALHPAARGRPEGESQHHRQGYAELESLGVIETIPGKGCFLKETQSLLRKDVRRKMLVQEIDQAIVQAHHLQVPGDEFLDLVRERMAALDDRRRANERRENS